MGFDTGTSRIWPYAGTLPTNTTDNVETWNWGINTTNNDYGICVDATPGALVWKMVPAGGGNLNTSRNYIIYNGAGGNPAAKAFATNYTPSATNDTFVIFPFSHTSVLLGSCTVDLLVDGVTVDTKGLSGVAATKSDSFSFICPKGKIYRVNASVTGIGSSNTVGVVKELPL